MTVPKTGVTGSNPVRVTKINFIPNFTIRDFCFRLAYQQTKNNMKLSNAQAQIVAQKIFTDMQTTAISKVSPSIRKKIKDFHDRIQHLQNQRAAIENQITNERARVKKDLGVEPYYSNSPDVTITNMISSSLPRYSDILAEVTIQAVFSKDEDFTTFTKRVEDKLKTNKNAN